MQLLFCMRGRLSYSSPATIRFLLSKKAPPASGNPFELPNGIC
ncbi:hypothetical protein SAMN02745190_01468 [Schwartzia succinivorans DSM 10502]|uniref:Uncharacterized protein n=1 Tax=Schwartzia succinivorans DSM 10502 TaxID=1123243 RepID=A0A1M4XFI8_9FIRM|nr:hypothetical protein SAMN02745190_01468 [Schwartzia succinivorans DSM 10502]